MEYKLKDGTTVSPIPLGKVSFSVGDINESGYLTIVGRAPNLIPSQSRVICHCKCGNYTVITYGAFKRGSTKSCGCYAIELHKKLMSEIGKKPKSKDYSNEDNLFYDFVRPLNVYKNRSRVWEIKCKACGRIYQEIPAMLVSETRRRGNNPCECWQKVSKGIKKIEGILTKENHSFSQEYKFTDCLSSKGNSMKFDFWVDNSCLIEYDGEQHFIETTWHGNENLNSKDRLIEQQEYDAIKNEWCLKNRIPLIRIPYTHYKDITIEDLVPETSNFLIKGEEDE